MRLFLDSCDTFQVFQQELTVKVVNHISMLKKIFELSGKL